jgi:hypothetical protein
MVGRDADYPMVQARFDASFIALLLPGFVSQRSQDSGARIDKVWVEQCQREAKVVGDQYT